MKINIKDFIVYCLICISLLSISIIYNCEMKLRKVTKRNQTSYLATRLLKNVQNLNYTGLFIHTILVLLIFIKRTLQLLLKD